MIKRIEIIYFMDIRTHFIIINFFQQNQIDMNRQSDMMAAFEENII